jgi:colicin import membrane protein
MATAALPPPRRPRTRHDTLPSFGLALMMHALLFGGFAFVVRWNTQDPAPVVAELWSAVPAPVVEAPPPPPPPPPPKVEPQPEPPKADADIVAKEEKKKPEPPKPPEKKVEEKKVAKVEPPPKRDPKKDLIADLMKKQEAQSRAEREAVRQAEAERILQQMAADRTTAGPTQPAGGTGARDADYRTRLAALIRSRIVYLVPEGTAESVYAEMQVELLPTGEVVGIRVLKPSGLPEYDAAVERAIRRTDPFPRKPDGTIDRTIVIRFRPVDQQR